MSTTKANECDNGSKCANSRKVPHPNREGTRGLLSPTPRHHQHHHPHHQSPRPRSTRSTGSPLCCAAPPFPLPLFSSAVSNNNLRLALGCSRSCRSTITRDGHGFVACGYRSWLATDECFASVSYVINVFLRWLISANSIWVPPIDVLFYPKLHLATSNSFRHAGKCS